MKYIIQIGSEPPTVILDPNKLLNQHPSIKEHPELFEIVEIEELPNNVQYLNYE
jgi:hypothetical protein